jgi:hypothetical protein
VQTPNGEEYRNQPTNEHEFTPAEVDDLEEAIELDPRFLMEMSDRQNIRKLVSDKLFEFQARFPSIFAEIEAEAWLENPVLKPSAYDAIRGLVAVSAIRKAPEAVARKLRRASQSPKADKGGEMPRLETHFTTDDQLPEVPDVAAAADCRSQQFLEADGLRALSKLDSIANETGEDESSSAGEGGS